MKLLSWIKKKLGLGPYRVYRCRHCGYEVPAEEIGKTVKLSGWPPLQHLHCPKCGRIIAVIPAKGVKRVHL